MIRMHKDKQFGIHRAEIEGYFGSVYVCMYIYVVYVDNKHTKSSSTCCMCVYLISVNLYKFSETITHLSYVFFVPMVLVVVHMLSSKAFKIKLYPLNKKLSFMTRVVLVKVD
jgi:hypothetical protein